MFPVWPFFAILFVILIFRKQLNCVPPLVLEEEPAIDNPPEPAEAEAPTIAIAENHITAEVSETEISAPIATPEPEPEVSLETKAKNNVSGSRYFCESLFWASQPKQAAKT
ncbi:hypothetical protein BJAS_P1812 [Bathymodiolus japonicus methanotrophic gill symbiont]|nr:hypothetical protein BJAS_P1812 [Bathymodiolus japonicus methanotrophic gill symbiont]